MNNARRKQIYRLQHQLELLKISFSEEKLHQCISVLEDIKSDEEEAFYNMPESFQCSDRGMDSEAAIDSLDEALGYLEEIMDLDDEDEIEVNIDIAIESLDDAAV